LPDPALAALWDSIIVEERVKTRLLSQAVLNFTIRAKVDRTVLPLHGIILMVGPPGTGKTSLALGLADRVAKSFSGAAFGLLEVDPHSLQARPWERLSGASRSSSPKRSRRRRQRIRR